MEILRYALDDICGYTITAKGVAQPLSDSKKLLPLSEDFRVVSGQGFAL